MTSAAPSTSPTEARARRAEKIRRLVAQAPPPTPQQIERLRALLPPVRRRHRGPEEAA